MADDFPAPGGSSEGRAPFRRRTGTVVASAARGAGIGSGVVLSADGRVLTDNHVVAGARRVTVTSSDGRTADARVVDSAIYSPTGAGGEAGSVGIGFAIPSNQAKRIADRLV